METTPNTAGPRICLKCNKEFQSSGAGNRRCQKCNNKAPQTTGIEDRVITTVPNRVIKDTGETG